MPVTLAQAKLNATDDVDVAIIDEFQKSNDVLNRITFDDVVSGAGNGATLTYGYTRQITQRGAAFRAINAEYTPTEATKARYTVDLKPLGGSFQVDRVLNRVAQAAETAFQMRELLKATSAKFNDAFFNGDTAVDANGFDGLSKLLTGTTTEYLPLSNGVTLGYLDWTAVNSQALAFAQIAHIDAWLGLLDGRPDVIYAPRKARALFKVLASFAGQYSIERNEIGQMIGTYDGIPIVDPGTKDGAATDVLALNTRDADAGGAGGNITNLADLYAVRYGLDGVHGVSMAGGPLVQNWMPDFTTAGAVKTGEAELGPAAVVVKRTKSAAVLRNVKVGCPVARIEAPNKEYNGRIGEVVFKDGVAETDNRAVIQYCQGAGYTVSGEKLNPVEETEVLDPRDVTEETLGTRLRDAAVDPKPGDFLPPTNAGQANPHDPEVVAPGIHAVSGPGPIVPGPVGKLEVTEDADGVRRVEVKSDPRGQAERETEAAQRVFVDQEQVPEATAALAEANPQQPADAQVEPPAGNASAEDWRTYAVEHRGATPEQVAGKKRDELREQYGPKAE